MIKLLLSLSICLLLLLQTSYVSAETTEGCKEDPRECFDGFEDDGTVITKDPTVSRTFSFPPVKAGFVVDAYNWDILPHIGVEVVSVSAPWDGDFSIDINVAASRLFTSLTWEFFPIIKAGPLVWVGYNIKQESPAYGVGFSILDF